MGTIDLLRGDIRRAMDNTRLSEIAHVVEHATLQCRRYEKDLFLNVGDAAQRATYFQYWTTNAAELDQAITRYAEAADSPAKRQLAVTWRENFTHYQQAFIQIAG